MREKKENNRASAPRLNNQEVHRQMLPWPQVWPRRQKTPQQQVLAGPAPIEGVEKMNAVIVRPQ